MFGLTKREIGTTPAVPSRTVTPLVDPWTEFSRLRQEMDSLFGSLFGSTPRWTEPVGAFTPAMDLYETPEELVLNAYLPGISREDIHLEVIGETIHITGETKPGVPEKDVTVHVAEGGYGKFELRAVLPVVVKTEEVKATYRNGILEVHLPKVETATPKPIPIQIAG